MALNLASRLGTYVILNLKKTENACSTASLRPRFDSGVLLYASCTLLTKSGESKCAGRLHSNLLNDQSEPFNLVLISNSIHHLMDSEYIADFNAMFLLLNFLDVIAFLNDSGFCTRRLIWFRFRARQTYRSSRLSRDVPLRKWLSEAAAVVDPCSLMFMKTLIPVSHEGS